MSHYPYGLKPGLSYNLAITTTTAVTTNPISVGVRVLRVVSTVNARFVIGLAPVAAGAFTCEYLPAAAVEYVQCSGDGIDKIAAVANAGSGTFNITEMSQ